jgi:tripartite ATP-independent transporter DctM subunit
VAVNLALSAFAAMLALMALRVPVAAAMFVPGAVAYWLLAGDGALLSHLKGTVWARFSNYDLTVIPLFLLMGQFASQGGLSRDLFRAANALVGRLRGGMAMAAVLACAAFGAICGSSVATAATIAQVALPEMRRAGYSGRLATATLAAGGTLGILIPPSVVLVIFAILTEQNIGRLFAAAVIPGLIAAIGYIVAIALTVRRHPEEAPPAAGGVVDLAVLTRVWPVLAIFVLVFGGIYGGLFTPTEGAAVGAVATFAAGWLRGELGRAALAKSLLGTAETTAMVFLIFVGADMLNAALALSQVPAEVARFVAALEVPPLLVVAAILALYVVLGAVMDELAMIVLTIPVLFPAVMGLDLWGLAAADKAIWFGILVLMAVEVGLIAPPVGLNVYVIHGIARDVPMRDTYRGVLPFLAADGLRIALVLLFPSLALFLGRALA